MSEHIIQIHRAGQWTDAALLQIRNPDQGMHSQFSLAYLPAYIVENLESLEGQGASALSATFPLSWETLHYSGAPALLLDIMPSGAARRAISAHFFDGKQPSLHSLLALAQSPVGHLRIKPDLDASPHIGFSGAEVIASGQDFTRHAKLAGAAPQCGLGAGGEAPKFLFAEDAHGRFHMDSQLVDEKVSKHWLVKYPRNRGSARDQDILRAEHLYYQTLAKLGYETVATEDMHLQEGIQPGLWLRRFDRTTQDGSVQRLAIESMYSLVGCNQHGSYLNHLDVLNALANLWRAMGQGHELAELVSDYLLRDMIKRILGDPDNHGRNMAIIRGERSVRLAPMYDLAPMCMDEEGIVRLTHWPRGMEHLKNPWHLISQACAHLANPDHVLALLREKAKGLLALPDLLSEAGLPNTVFNHPGVPLRKVEERVQLPAG